MASVKEINNNEDIKVGTRNRIERNITRRW